MNGKQLRTSILQEAITGRLVPQDPNDEPASELLHRINPKATPLETDQPLPQGWCACQLKDMVSITTGDKDANHGKENGQYDFFTCARAPIKSDTYSFEGESLILPGNGDIGLITHYNGRFEAYQRTYVLQALSADVYLRYLYWHMSANWRAYNKDRLYGSAIPYIRLSNLATYPVYLPPLAEQKRIVAKIEELMPLVDEYEKAQEEFDNLNAGLKSKLRASLLQEAIAGRLVPQDPNDEPASELLHRINPKATPLETDEPLPQGWCATTLSDICTTINGLWKGKKGPFVNVGVIRNANFTKDFKLDYSKIQYLDVEQKSFAKRKLLDGDLIVEKSGGGDKTPVGRAILYEGENGIYSFSNFTMLLRIRNKAEILPKYIYYFLLAKYRSGAMVGMQTHTTGLRNLETDKYLSMLFPLPPLAEQKRIVEKLESMFAVLDNLDTLTA